MFIFTATLITALFGFIWDVSLHIGKGRDAGPLANPAHYFILIGLFLLFIAEMVAIIVPFDKPGPAAVRITRNWYAPVGGLRQPLLQAPAANRWKPQHNPSQAEMRALFEKRRVRRQRPALCPATGVDPDRV